MVYPVAVPLSQESARGKTPGGGGVSSQDHKFTEDYEVYETADKEAAKRDGYKSRPKTGRLFTYDARCFN